MDSYDSIPNPLCLCGCGKPTKNGSTFVHGHFNARRTLKERFQEKVQLPEGEGCWLWIGARDAKGYGMIGSGHGGPNLRAHRASWELHYGSIPPELQVCHHCDNPSCVRPDHLFLGTRSDNLQDASRKGRLNFQKDPTKRPRGSRHGAAKLNESQVVTIRARYAAGGILQRELADEYGVTNKDISLIVLRKRWSHID